MMFLLSILYTYTQFANMYRSFTYYSLIKKKLLTPFQAALVQLSILQDGFYFGVMFPWAPELEKIQIRVGLFNDANMLSFFDQSIRGGFRLYKAAVKNWPDLITTQCSEATYLRGRFNILSVHFGWVIGIALPEYIVGICR